MKLGVDHFSIRSQGWTAFEILDYCRSIGLDLVHFSSLEPFESTEDEYLLKVKAHADELGMGLEVGMLSICSTSTIFDTSAGTAEEQMRHMLHIADVLGSPILRCVLGSQADRSTELPFEAHMENAVASCRAVRSQAMDLGIKIAIENHAGDMQGWELAQLIVAAGPEYVGACIDAGNPVWVAEDPLVTLEHVAPYVATSHIRDSAVWAHPRGAAVQWVAMGDGNIDIVGYTEAFKRLCPDVPYTLEIITGMAPRVLNYFEPEFWTLFQNARAHEFARFERLVRNGTPFIGTMVQIERGDDVPEEYEAARVAQERHDLERSVRFCRETLGVGK